MVDSGSDDEKIIAIPKSDPTYNQYRDVSDLPAHIFEEMKHFFRVYKNLENKETVVKDLKNREEAIKVIAQTIEAYNDKFGK